MDVVEKLRVMLPHWVEHNRSHGKEFAEWAAQLAESNSDLAAQLDKAVHALSEAQQALEKALLIAGGAAEHSDHGHHHHHH
jgi:hypothetical protein